MFESQAPTSPAKRPHCSMDERRRLVELTFEKGASLSKIAKANDVHPSSLSHWRSLYRVGKLSVRPSKKVVSVTEPNMTFLPVKLTSEPARDVKPIPAASPALTSGYERTILHVSIPSGATVRIETGSLNIALLAAILAEVRA